MPADYLNETQLKFAEEYIKDPSSKTGAAVRAGYAHSGACEAATRMLKHPLVKQMIEEANKEAALSLGITALRVMQELSNIAFAKPGSKVVVGEDGSDEIVVDPNDTSEINVTTTAAGGKKAKTTSVKTIRNSDKIAALSLIAKSMGILKDRVEVEHTGSLVELIEASFKPEAD